MAGVRIPKNVHAETKKKLGFETVANMSFMWGVSYPLPDWYSSLSDFKKTLWMIYCRFGDLMMTLLFLSNIFELFTAYNDIRAFVTCTGTITYIICFRIKLLIFKRNTETLENVIYFLHKITENLDNNPVKNSEFFEIYKKYLNHVIFFGKGKIGAIAGGVCTLAVYEMIHGYLQESDKKRNLPMFGWYPYDPYQLFYFEISCLFQLVSYLSFLLKDVVVDLLFLTTLVILNTHLIYLRILLGQIIEDDEKPVGLVMPPDKRALLVWWIKRHQTVLKTIEDFKEITNPYLFYKYISVGIILFFGGVLVTSQMFYRDIWQQDVKPKIFSTFRFLSNSMIVAGYCKVLTLLFKMDTEYDLIQQMIVLAINSSNLLQLYIFSIVGDEITENGLKLTELGLHGDIICNNKNIRTLYLYTATKCSMPILIHFGQINPLCVASFAQIVKVTFSYFLTIVQIRNKTIESDEMKTLYINSTQQVY